MVALPRPWLVTKRRAKPRVLIGRVVGHDVEQHPDPERVRFGDQCLRLVEGSVGRLDVAVVGDVVTCVGHRRGIPRVDPDGINSELRHIGQPHPQPVDVTDAVAVTVGEAADVDLVDDGGLPPGRYDGNHGTPRGICANVFVTRIAVSLDHVNQ